MALEKASWSRTSSESMVTFGSNLSLRNLQFLLANFFSRRVTLGMRGLDVGGLRLGWASTF